LTFTKLYLGFWRVVNQLWACYCHLSGECTCDICQHPLLHTGCPWAILSTVPDPLYLTHGVFVFLYWW